MNIIPGLISQRVGTSPTRRYQKRMASPKLGRVTPRDKTSFDAL